MDTGIKIHKTDFFQHIFGIQHEIDEQLKDGYSITTGKMYFSYNGVINASKG